MVLYVEKNYPIHNSVCKPKTMILIDNYIPVQCMRIENMMYGIP